MRKTKEREDNFFFYYFFGRLMKGGNIYKQTNERMSVEKKRDRS